MGILNVDDAITVSLDIDCFPPLRTDVPVASGP